MLRILRNIVLVVVVLVVVLVAGGLGYRAIQKSRAAPELAIETPAGIDEARLVEAGGIEHWVTIRGQDRDNPVLFFLHGGPGETVSHVPSVFQLLEEDFTIVQWDQRGAGRTYGRNPKPPADLTLEQMTRDGVQIASWAADHLDQQSVILVGFSWGSILGEHMAQARPDLFSAYVGTGQFESWARQVELQYRHALARADAEGDDAALAVLREAGPPPYDTLQDYLAARETMIRYISPADQDFATDQVWRTLFGPRASLGDIWNTMRGLRASSALIEDVLWRAEMSEIDSEFAMPVFIVQGAEDRITPIAAARTHFERINAPTRGFIPIDGAGHYAAMTHTEAFLDVLTSTVLPAVEAYAD